MATSQTCCHLPGEMLNSAAEYADRPRIHRDHEAVPLLCPVEILLRDGFLSGQIRSGSFFILTRPTSHLSVKEVSLLSLSLSLSLSLFLSSFSPSLSLFLSFSLDSFDLFRVSQWKYWDKEKEIREKLRHAAAAGHYLDGRVSRKWKQRGGEDIFHLCVRHRVERAVWKLIQ
jgi:hypothetical protein